MTTPPPSPSPPAGPPAPPPSPPPAGPPVPPSGGRPGRWRDEAVAAGWLALVWNLFWGEFTVGNLIGGLAIGVIVLVFFPLPPVTFGGQIRPWAALSFAVRFIGELVSASARVAWAALRPGPPPRGAIIAVPLRVRTDLNLALTAEVISLVPGTLILEVDRTAGTLYVHVLDVRGPQDLVASRKRIRDVERRLVRAVGSAAELRQVQTTEKGEAG
ncbi:Na+/H+ antiporter subunit E [Micromonospora sp. CPCC 206060]|uniref:Na+/H+ antiporter subunit E n=1 Tax=Micromonospora sp. CPCC 206060 TaxID=3122406 RepID=UPI002FF0D6D5